MHERVSVQRDAMHDGDAATSRRWWAEAPCGQPYFGESHFTGPNGLATNMSTHAELIIADLDLGELARPDPSGWNLPRDLRPDIYSARR